ncbi:branched-chain amino acid ABC transporter permease [Roseovarius sp. ZX-A-9]|uniref:branched-chain amino acid ABC transporter permease n=1 Tax=Roseovarius sp. ZX-A-9 TaxID=3014783 RepID=UPI00232AF675|nr:branched-chain amino acid ABC transporter permease [Roseovarius sp. ZX-A-9]
MDTFIFVLVNGLLYGMLLFMLSSGLTLIFSLMGVLNFAHASFYMLGAYFAYQLASFGSFWLGLILAPLLVGCLGAAIERFGLRIVHKHGHVAELLFTFGLAYLIEELVRLIWGRQPVPYRIPESLDFTLFSVSGIDYSAYRAFMLLIAVAMFISVLLLLKRTRVGLMVQAALSHPDVLWAMGHNVPRLFMLVFGGGVALAGLAGVIGGNYLVTEPGMAQQMGTILFVIVVFGGLGSLLGAFLASLIIGITQTLMVTMDGTLTDLITSLGGAAPHATGMFREIWTIAPANLAPVFPYLLLVILLIVRPRGLLGTRES